MTPMPAEPCPWCGDEGTLVLERTETAAWHVHCKTCFANGPSCRDVNDAGPKWDAWVARCATGASR